MERYSRQTMLPEIGHDGQKRLLGSSALIVGLGGLGCPAAMYLTAAGVGRIGLCDPDSVSLTNLQRQILYTEARIGTSKTEAARERLSAMSSHTRFDLWPDGLKNDNAAHIIGRYDIVVDCCDNFATRYLIDDTCRQLGKPWIHGAISSYNGQVSTFLPSPTVSYRDLYPDSEALSSLPPAQGGVLGAVPGIVGAIEAAEALKVLAGSGDILYRKLLTLDIKTLHFNIITF